jgi:hypothetical protein
MIQLNLAEGEETQRVTIAIGIASRAPRDIKYSRSRVGRRAPNGMFCHKTRKDLRISIFDF